MTLLKTPFGGKPVIFVGEKTTSDYTLHVRCDPRRTVCMSVDLLLIACLSFVTSDQPSFQETPSLVRGKSVVSVGQSAWTTMWNCCTKHMSRKSSTWPSWNLVPWRRLLWVPRLSESCPRASNVLDLIRRSSRVALCALHRWSIVRQKYEWITILIRVCISVNCHNYRYQTNPYPLVDCSGLTVTATTVTVLNKPDSYSYTICEQPCNHITLFVCISCCDNFTLLLGS